MKVYLFSYKFFGNFHRVEQQNEIAGIHRIAKTIGFSDCTDFHDFKVYELIDGVPVKRDWDYGEYHGYSRNDIVLIDPETGEVTAAAEYESH